MNLRFIVNIVLLSLWFYTFNSCSSKKILADKRQELVIYPAPPDTARIQYLTSFSSSQDISGKQPKIMKSIFGEQKPVMISKPFGIEIKNGKIYVCDINLKGLVIIDLEKNKVEYFMPSGKGRLKLPHNCFIDENEFLYIADGNRHQIVIFDKEGNYINAFGKGGEDYKPTDVFVYDNKIWVANVKSFSIDVYEKASPNKFLYSFPENQQNNTQKLFQPTNIFINNNKVYVTDFGDFKIKIFNLNGEFIESVGSYGNNLGQFVRPKGIAVDKESNLFVVDAGFENTQIFNKEGKLLMYFGGSDRGSGSMYLPAGIALDYNNLKYFEKYVDDEYQLNYLIFVTNQYGANKVNVYGAIQPK